MDIVADPVWKGRLKGTKTLSPPIRTIHFYFTHRYMTPSIIKWATTMAGVALYIKYPIPALRSSLITRVASQTLHDPCTKIPGKKFQNSNFKFIGKK